MYKTLLLIPLLLLSGCLVGGDDYEKYSEALKAHSESESYRVSEQAHAIAQAANVPTATQTESTLLAVIAMMQIERLQYSPLGISAPITGYSVLNTAVSHIPFMTTTLGMYKLGEAAINSAGNVIMKADEINTSDSFNRTEVHATGDSNTAAANADRDHSTKETTTTNTDYSGGY